MSHVYSWIPGQAQTHPRRHAALPNSLYALYAPDPCAPLAALSRHARKPLSTQMHRNPDIRHSPAPSHKPPRTSFLSVLLERPRRPTH